MWKCSLLVCVKNALKRHAAFALRGFDCWKFTEKKAPAKSSGRDVWQMAFTCFTSERGSGMLSRSGLFWKLNFSTLAGGKNSPAGGPLGFREAINFSRVDKPMRTISHPICCGWNFSVEEFVQLGAKCLRNAPQKTHVENMRHISNEMLK